MAVRIRTVPCNPIDEETLSVVAKKLTAAEPTAGKWISSAGTRILAALLWADQHHVAEARNHIVHATWWDFADTGVTRSRFFLNGESEFQFLDWERLEDDCRNLRNFYEMLDRIVGDEWPRLRLLQTSGEVRKGPATSAKEQE